MNKNRLDKKTAMRVLVIDIDGEARRRLLALLKDSECLAEPASGEKEALKKLGDRDYDFVLCDQNIANLNIMAFVQSVLEKLQETPFVLMTAADGVDVALAAMKLGAFGYITKPVKADEMRFAINKARERKDLKLENSQLKERIRKIHGECNFSEMVAKSDAMQAVFKIAEKAARYDTMVLVTGESGTGKELMSKGIHVTGKRAGKPFIPVNCGGIPESLLETEFFGYKKGAFTGADKNRKGLFEEAGGGTLFLDEIGELPMVLQVKLLRVLQEKEIRRVGDSKTRKVDVRVIAATSKNLEEEVAEGRFRQDLFYRLNVLPIEIPPLRDRTGDIPILCRHFLEHFKDSMNTEMLSISHEAMSALLEYAWPGNVRELENVLERAVVLAEDGIIRTENLPAPIRMDTETTTLDGLFEGYSIKAAQKVLERQLIEKALQATGGNRTKASALLEISHPSLLSKMKAYDIV